MVIKLVFKTVYKQSIYRLNSDQLHFFQYFLDIDFFVNLVIVKIGRTNLVTSGLNAHLNGLTHSCPDISLAFCVILTNNTFENNIGVKHEVTIFKESRGFDYEQHFP